MPAAHPEDRDELASDRGGWTGSALWRARAWRVRVCGGSSRGGGFSSPNHELRHQDRLGCGPGNRMPFSAPRWLASEALALRGRPAGRPPSPRTHAGSLVCQSDAGRKPFPGGPRLRAGRACRIPVAESDLGTRWWPSAPTCWGWVVLLVADSSIRWSACRNACVIRPEPDVGSSRAIVPHPALRYPAEPLQWLQLVLSDCVEAAEHGGFTVHRQSSLSRSTTIPSGETVGGARVPWRRGRGGAPISRNLASDEEGRALRGAPLRGRGLLRAPALGQPERRALLRPES